MKQPRNGVQEWDRSPELMAVSRGITSFRKEVRVSGRRFSGIFFHWILGASHFLDKATTNRGVDPLGNSREFHFPALFFSIHLENPGDFTKMAAMCFFSPCSDAFFWMSKRLNLP